MFVANLVITFALCEAALLDLVSEMLGDDERRRFGLIGKVSVIGCCAGSSRRPSPLRLVWRPMRFRTATWPHCCRRWPGSRSDGRQAIITSAMKARD
jgi:hypothetical protein